MGASKGPVRYRFPPRSINPQAGYVTAWNDPGIRTLDQIRAFLEGPFGASA